MKTSEETQERTLLYENKPAIRKAQESSAFLSDMLEKALNRWYAMQLPAGMTPQFIWKYWVSGQQYTRSRIQDAENLIRELIYTNSDFFKGAPIAKETALGMIQMPEGFPAFAGSLESLNNHLDFTRQGHHADLPIELFSYDQETGKIILDEAGFTAYLERYRRYATDTEMECLEDLKEIEKLMDAFEAKYPKVKLLLSPHGSREPDALFYESERTGKIVFDRNNLRL
jgi:hypothetical protein